MRTLYLDCANTLVTWSGLFNQHGKQAWQPNWDVVAAAERWHATGAGEVVVWSEKGAADAEQWARRIVPLLSVTTRDKDLSLPQPGDVCIDDVSLAVGCVCYRPNQSFMVACDV